MATPADYARVNVTMALLGAFAAGTGLRFAVGGASVGHAFAAEVLGAAFAVLLAKRSAPS